MSKQVYISADYAENDGDREVVNVLHKWSDDNVHKVSFVDMSQVASGSVSQDSDCRPCDLKKEFNAQINASSAVIFIVGDMTAYRTAGSSCSRAGRQQYESTCTPYKQNTNGTKTCKVYSTTDSYNNPDVGNINNYSYLRHEFEQAKKRNKKIIILFNSLRNEMDWLPSYMKGYEQNVHPFWKKNYWGEKVGDYDYIKEVLGVD
ncbi:MAG: hypothetical protein ACLUW4_11500 [Butyribacter sp.]|jgi:hypothetical protein|uniref:hypothetical protein n=1 Tax=Butyribacter sp. TaxID=2822465 RepID=UPI0038475DAD|nr:hypothetical protein [Roseburia hominis]